MSTPANLMYSKTHEWLRVEGTEIVVGITHFAQESLGDITYVDMPAVGLVLEKDQGFGAVESVKAASDLYAPVGGEVVAVNEALIDAPELLNQSPYDQGWIMRIKVSSPPQDMLDATAYDALCAAEAH